MRDEVHGVFGTIGRGAYWYLWCVRLMVSAGAAWFPIESESNGPKAFAKSTRTAIYVIASSARSGLKPKCDHAHRAKPNDRQPVSPAPQPGRTSSPAFSCSGTACSTTSPANPLQGSSLACTAASTVAGDASHYQYADTVHPTPYGYQLLAQNVTLKLITAGWQ